MNPEKILIIEDNEVSTKLLRLMLRGCYQTQSATDGSQGIELAQTTQPDLILLDVMMPGIDGWEVCRMLKQNPVTAQIPVLFISAKAEAADIVRGFSAGGDDYVAKPFNQEEVRARVAHHLKLKSTQDELRRTVQELQRSLEEIKTLTGLIPICAYCKKIRSDQGYWEQVEMYVSRHTKATFSHGICPECICHFFPPRPPEEGASNAAKIPPNG